MSRNRDEEDVVDDHHRLSGRSNDEGPVEVSDGTGSWTRNRRSLLEKSGHRERDQARAEKKLEIENSYKLEKFY